MDRPESLKARALRILRAFVVALCVVLVAGAAVEVLNHVGVLGGLGLNDQIAKAISDASMFSVAGAVAYLAWKEQG